MRSTGDQIGTRCLPAAMHRLATRVSENSVLIARTIERRAAVIACAWATTMAIAAGLRIATSTMPVHTLTDLVQMALPYAFIVLAPITGYLLASASFPAGHALPQPAVRLARIGTWRRLTPDEARARPKFGPSGFLASLLIGLLLSIALRGWEFAIAMPALNHHAPIWGYGLFRIMALDVAVTAFFYAACLAMALRAAPLFPRMLLFTWLCDITMQLGIASVVASLEPVPTAVAAPLSVLLTANIHKVLISIAVWLPFLVLSERVNVTYRLRTARR